MAYLFGIVTEEEAEKLEALGWELEDPADVMREMEKTLTDTRNDCGTKRTTGRRFVGCFVDSDVFEIMTGPDWEKVPTRCARCASPLDAVGHCQDETCPFSVCSQDSPEGWVGHPGEPS